MGTTSTRRLRGGGAEAAVSATGREPPEGGPPVGAEVTHTGTGLRGTVDDKGMGKATVRFDGGLVSVVAYGDLDWDGKAEPVTDDAGPRQSIGTLVREVDGRYVVRGRDGGDREISDFVVTVTARVHVDGDDAQLAFEARIGDKAHTLPAGLFSNPTKFQFWCNQRGLAWGGSLEALRGLYDLLNSADAPDKRGVTVTGLHTRTWVLPDEVFGELAGDVAYVMPPLLERPPEHGLGHEWGWSSPWTPFDAFALVARLHRPDIVTPILGWLAAAPLRSLFRNFPVLAVTGHSGWGKTTLLRAAMEAFGYGTPFNLTGSTPHAVTTYGASTNAFPVWFDEYRRNVVRQDTRERLEQLLRDAWDGSSSARAGVGDNVSQVRRMPACAPVVVSGEESLTEVSHVERTVIVNVPKDGRDPTTLKELMTPTDELGGFPPAAQLQGLGRAYLEWLLDDRDALAGRPWAPDRREHGLAVVRWGYGLLVDFCMAHDADVLPAFDDSRVRRDSDEAAAANPVAEMIEEALGVVDRDGRFVAWDEDGRRWLRPGALSKWARDNRPTVTLPGGQKAIAQWAREEHKAVNATHRLYGRAVCWPTPTAQPAQPNG